MSFSSSAAYVRHALNDKRDHAPVARLVHRRQAGGERYLGELSPEKDGNAVRGLMIALPISLALWAPVLWAASRLI